MEERKVILKIEHLCKDFDIKAKSFTGKALKLHALSDISLDIYEGETLGIIGESGCGKSTLGRCLVNLHPITSGKLVYDGKELNRLRKKERQALSREIQMVFQDPYSSLDPRHTAADSVEEPMIVHKTPATARERQERTIGLFKEVGLDMQHLNRYPHEFSGGQRQRLNIARAIASNPRVVICDEPVSALDVSIQAQVINLFKKLQKHFNLTYIFISHDLSVVKYISDRIAIMYLGRLVELCDSDSIYHNPLHPYTKALLSAIPPESPEEEKERIVLTGEVPSPIGEQKGCPLANRCPRCMKRCREELPKLLPHGDTDHMVACFLYQNERD